LLNFVADGNEMCFVAMSRIFTAIEYELLLRKFFFYKLLVVVCIFMLMQVEKILETKFMSKFN